jgi:hypothetical protein
MNGRDTLKSAVVKRARNRCEYCHIPIVPGMPPFHLEHIVAGQHGGMTVLHNLALSCSRCNAHKGPNLAGIDPKTRRKSFLFDPRIDTWSQHFERRGPRILGKTMKGRATVATLDMNGEERLDLRLALIDEGLIEAVE